MRIPTSVVVMSCVTALPFGLAIRDTVRGTQRGDELDVMGDQAREREIRARAEREAAKSRAELEALERERDAELDTLYGKTIASRGTVTESTREFDVVFDDDVMTIAIPMAFCDRLHRKLELVWGPPANDIWLDPATHHRAAFSDDECSLRYDSYIEPDALVAQIPFSLMGTVADQTAWDLPGTGAGRAITHIYAETAHDKVVAINVVGETDLDTQAKIREALAMRLGRPAVPSDSDPNVWTYNSKPAVRFDASGAWRFSIQIGTPTWQ